MDLFVIARELNEPAEDAWTQILQTDGTDCETANKQCDTGRSDIVNVFSANREINERLRKIGKSIMTFETTTDIIHEHMSARLNN